MKRSEKETLFGFAVLVFLVVALVLWFYGAGLGSASQDRIVSACGLVVQMDSFFGAAYFGGLFLYGSVVFRRLGRFPIWWNFFFDSFIGYGGSGILAVGGSVTGQSIYLLLALTALLYALFVSVVVVVRIHYGVSET